MDSPAIPVRTSSKKAVILPDRYINLMPAKSQNDLRDRQHRTVSIASQITGSNTITDFLENRNALLQERVGFHKAYEKHLGEALKAGTISNAEYQEAMNAFVKELEEALRELNMLKRGRHAFEEDLAEMEQETKRKRTYESLWDEIKRLTNSYSTSMVWRVMHYGKNDRKKPNQSHFRNRVMKHLNAMEPKEGLNAWCHLMGWQDKSEIKAAHIVPKTLQDVELKELFGSDVDVMYDPRNGITLHHKIEVGLDNGIITFMPIPTSSDESTRWICHLVDDSKRNAQVGSPAGIKGILRWGDLDKKELTFLSENRPARRYLYFRFIITYIFAKRAGNVGWAADIEERKVLWATPGKYLRGSMLRALARNLSGADPPAWLSDNTFEPEGTTDESALKFCNDVRRAAIESDIRAELEAKREAGELSDTSDDEETDVDDEREEDY